MKSITNQMLITYSSYKLYYINLNVNAILMFSNVNQVITYAVVIKMQILIKIVEVKQIILALVHLHFHMMPYQIKDKNAEVKFINVFVLQI